MEKEVTYKTLRDEIAMIALPQILQLISKAKKPEYAAPAGAKICYLIADAMLKAREED